MWLPEWVTLRHSCIIATKMVYYSLLLWNPVLREGVLPMLWRHNGRAGTAPRPSHFTPGKNCHTRWIRGWVVPQPVWTFQRREKSHVSTGVQNPYLAACSIVTIAHSFTQTTKWTNTRNQHTLQSPVCIMYCTQSAVMPTVLDSMWSFFYWIYLSCGLYLKLFVSSAHTCTKQHYVITVISLIYQKVDKGTS